MNLKNKTSKHQIHHKIFKQSEKIRASSADKLMYYSHQYHDGQCRCVIQFDGRLDIILLTRAVELSLEVAPVLGYRFVYHPWQSYWKKDAISNLDVPFRHVETPDPGKETDRFLAELMDAQQGNQVSVGLIRSGNDTLVIKLSHMVADAMGLLDYIQILSHLYNHLQSNPDYIPLKSPKHKRGVGQVLRHVGITAMVKGFLHWRYPKSEWGFPQVSADFSAGEFPVRLIGHERLKSIKAFCREKKVKFTDVITTAFYQALIDILKPVQDSRLPIQMTMDLRSYLPSGKAETICNLTGAFYPVIRYKTGKTFDQALNDVAKAIAAARERKSWFGGVLFLEMITMLPGFIQTWFASLVTKRELSGGTSHPFFSNLGVINPTLANFGDLKAVDLGLFGPVSYPPNFLATAYSFRGQLYINSSFCPTAADPQQVERFLDNFVNYLPT